MKKRIAIEELKVGMYVSELDRPQLESSPRFRGLWIRSQAQIDKLKRYCQYVYIDVPKSYPYPSSRRPASGKWPPSKAFTTEQERKLEFEILKLGATPQDMTRQYPDQTTLEEEVNTIRACYEETKDLVKTIMQDARRKKEIDATRVKAVVALLVQSIIRNANALVCFAQLRKKEEYTTLHNVRVCVLALALGRHLVLNPKDLDILGIGALLHDIGKMKVPSEILNKPESLTQREFELMKNHVRWGVQVLKNTKGIPNAAIDVARYHHERWDGSGYLSRLKKDRTPYFGQIGGIVDCYDALTSDRIYGAAISAHDALKRIYEWRNKEFSVALVEQFIQCMGIYPIGSVVELNTGDVGVVVTVNRVRRLKPRVRLALKPDKTPYRFRKTINLMHDTTSEGRPVEIDRALEPGAYAVNPIEYLPITVHH